MRVFQLRITKDVDGDLRYDTGWDIGADEAPTVLYRSVGLHNYDLNSGGETVTIANATNTSSAVFSGNIADNIGVGDAIEYGSPLQLAFIMGRVSSSTYYVQSATGSPPVATSSASASVYRAHEHLDDWEDQVVGDVNQVIDAGLQDDVLVNQDLVVSNTAMYVPCYASTSADSLATNINGWTTATSSFIKVYTPVNSSEVGVSQRHNGVWSDDKYRIEYSAINNYDYIIRIMENVVQIDGLQIGLHTGTYTQTEGIAIIVNEPESVDIVIKNNIVQQLSGARIDSQGIGGDSNRMPNGQVYIYNNIVYDFTGTCIAYYGKGEGYIYNNTVFNCGYKGIYSAVNVNNLTVLNNVVASSTDDFVGAIYTVLDHNASDDLDGTNPIDISPASLGTEQEAWKAAFMDYENGDFRIRDNASVLFDSGTSIVIVTEDIAGNSRPLFNGFDIGAFELTDIVPKYRVRGTIRMKGTVKFK